MKSSSTKITHNKKDQNYSNFWAISGIRVIEAQGILFMPNISSRAQGAL
jgi:hypothetical protein